VNGADTQCIVRQHGVSNPVPEQKHQCRRYPVTSPFSLDPRVIAKHFDSILRGVG
jgi:hypothetical protein